MMTHGYKLQKWLHACYKPIGYNLLSNKYTCVQFEYEYKI